MTHQIYIKHQADGAFGRFVDCTTADLLSHVSKTIRDFEGTTELVITTGPTHHYEPKPVTFTNVCGKITHRKDPYVVRDALRPLLCHVTNSFGTFKALYSPLCNLTVCHVGNCTLFRGARSCADVRTIVSHALRSECLIESFMHMVVASSRVGRPIFSSNTRLRDVLCTDPRWSGRVRAEPEDKQYQCCFELSRFDSVWCSAMLEGRADAPLKVLLNINRKGSVNYFLSLVPSTAMKLFGDTGVDEDTFRPLCDFFHRLIATHS